MSCNCKKNKKSSIERSIKSMTSDLPTTVVLATAEEKREVVFDAKSIRLPQCYLCAKKHIGRAQQFFEEYHTGYDNRIKLMTDSLKVSEQQVRKAFLLRQKTQSQLDMASGELLGGDSSMMLDDAHIAVANKIRTERLALQDNPLHVPDFDQLLVDIQLLQYSE